ncbi:nucleoside-diphosphate sugar epimerase [Actinoplanes cyaneus]|uniref:Nucleoside-diphosphate sugar epimerase n=1 Tax=Actinoplanes cyaneus TaxID=52696 RepID=A0A919II18_9ACTN|nr:NAD-dependent epimerase/dehydratase family protein [Actinoplanes cyaneus]MCW2138231.1 UDP-glucose 4-epimerase/UDP-glucuronate decarboxylase [Actinoplanes cyaneus]GID66189.1 nucleoside-diphosphate sugar epimerase [Actinoplanes cyaneus]
MAERYLITGGAGFIGLHLVRHLLGRGARVVVLDDFSRGRHDPELAAVAGDIELITHDLTTPIPPEALRGSFDGVFHLAAVVGVARANSEPARVLDANVRATLHVLDWCRTARPGALFLSSTSEVADGAGRLGLASYPIAERVPFLVPDLAAPRASYALGKAASEALVLAHRDQFRVRIGRYHNIYGPRMGEDHVIPQFIRRALARTDPFPLYGATQTRAFCHVDDAVRASVDLLRLPAADPLVANIGNDREEIKIDHLAVKVAGLAGYDPVFVAHEPPAGSPDRRLPDLTTIGALTGYQPEVGLDRGLRATFDWYATR